MCWSNLQFLPTISDLHLRSSHHCCRCRHLLHHLLLCFLSVSSSSHPVVFDRFLRFSAIGLHHHHHLCPHHSCSPPRSFDPSLTSFALLLCQSVWNCPAWSLVCLMQLLFPLVCQSCGITLSVVALFRPILVLVLCGTDLDSSP